MDLLLASAIDVFCIYITVLDMNDCSPNPCQNGGICTYKVAGFTCECTAGYNGDNCENSKFTYKCVIIVNGLKRIVVLSV